MKHMYMALFIMLVAFLLGETKYFEDKNAIGSDFSSSRLGAQIHLLNKLGA